MLHLVCQAQKLSSEPEGAFGASPSDGFEAVRRSIAVLADEYELTADAIDIGLDAALPPVIELESQIGEFGRGERDSPSETQRTVRILLINQTPARERSEETA